MARHSSGPRRPGAFVTALTVAALGVVAFFAYQASAADDRPLASPPTGESSSDGSGRGGGEGDGGPGGEGGGAGGGQDQEPPLPADSGTGKRVVYSVGQSRIWLVDIAADGTGEIVEHTHEAFPSSVDPPPGEYQVTSATEQTIGSDGVPIENVLVFHAAADATVFGFSSATDGSTPDPDAQLRTGAVRQSREDGELMWDFAPVGTPVVVVP
ncbi:hypothetical protein ACTWP5_20050 [Streptomyces sp. 4N509B]|uniref:hypothetical protein n=1 Tax=Streptomyces sp. 4N509B TaxID=3457413 RepID=UPI003FD4BD2E